MGIYYRGMMNRFALNTLIKNPETPDFHLMVGAAEDLAPMPLMIYKDVTGVEVKPLIPDAKREDVDLSLQGTTYAQSDFPNNIFWLGAAIDGGYA